MYIIEAYLPVFIKVEALQQQLCLLDILQCATFPPIKLFKSSPIDTGAYIGPKTSSPLKKK
jgi:hypothetical protein